MVISDEIETATIATYPGIDEATIVEIRTTFVSPFQLSLTTSVVVKWRQINLPKSVQSVQSFCLLTTPVACLLSRLSRRFGCAELAVNVTT